MNKEKFIEELKKININIDNNKLLKLEEFYKILKEENSKYNLTRIIEEEEVYLKHYYDSLTITKIIKIDNQSICDLGTGAGFPGIVLAIFFPNTKITLIESNGKKCNFLNIVKQKLSLDNINIINARIEEYAKNNRELFDIVTARAVAPIKHLLEYGIPLVKISGYFIAMKSNVENEEKNINIYYKKLSILEEDRVVFNLPIEHSLRTLIKYKKIDKTNAMYPRKYTEIKKKDI